MSYRMAAAMLLGAVSLGCAAKGDPAAPTKATTDPSGAATATPSDPAEGAAPGGPAAAADTQECMLRLELDRHHSLLDEHRQHTSVDDFHERIAASAITPDYHPVQATKAITVADRPALWFTPDYASVVVDQALASALEVVDATRLSAGETKRVGTLTEAGRAGLAGRGWVELLLRASVIGTWIHIGSEVCLSAETQSEGGGYRVSIDGEHTYFTNEENVDPLHFDVTIGPDGAIDVIGR